MVQEVAVVIPYYHNDLSITERISYEQCRKVLHNFPIMFVVPDGFEISAIEKFPEKWGVVEVPPQWLSSVGAYNQMMLNRKFYEAFQQYEYILIYQLDAYVFSNRLLEFCSYGYDYIGAPWIEGKFEPKLADRGIFYVGNGGFSLRKVDACLQQLCGIMPEQIECNEDVFWASRENSFNIAPKEIAWQFAFERPVQTLYKLNGEEMPFGCHAWMKYDFEFFRPYMLKDGYSDIVDVRCSRQRDLTSEYIDQRYLTAARDIVWKSILENCGIIPSTIWIYGAGQYGSLCGYLLHDFDNCRISCADRDEKKWGKTIWGIPVMTPDEIDHVDGSLVIVAMKSVDSVIKKLLDCGFSQGTDLLDFQTLVHAINRKMP